LRSGESVFHHEAATGSGCGRGADFAFGVDDLLFPDAGVTVLPLGFPAGLEDAEGVLRGMRLPIMHKPLNLQETKGKVQISCLTVYAVIESIAQMVCFSFPALSIF
jgi:hypothetical protein